MLCCRSGEDGGCLSSYIPVLYKSTYGVPLQLTYQGVRYKLKDLIARSVNIEMFDRNTQPYFRYRSVPGVEMQH